MQIGFSGCWELTSFPSISFVLGIDYALDSSGKIIFLEFSKEDYGRSCVFVFNIMKGELRGQQNYN